MARTQITDDMKVQINELFLKYKTFSGVARELGIAPSTVKKYIIPNYVSTENLEIKKFEGEILDFDISKFKNVENWGDLCTLSEQEVEEVKEFWKELSI